MRIEIQRAKAKIAVMIKLKQMQDTINASIERQKKDFYRACKKVCPKNKPYFRYGKALISKSHTKRVWFYSRDIVALEKKLASKKNKFKLRNDPCDGGKLIWVVFRDEDTFKRSQSHINGV